MNNKTLIDSIQKIKDEYYSKNKKLSLFKKTQKSNCAKNVAENSSLDELISKTVFIIQNTNKVCVDYEIFKSFANNDNYKIIIDRLICLIMTVINIFGNFEIHLNLKSFSVSAVERYRDVFELYYDRCLVHDLYYNEVTLSKIEIYHTPSVINLLSKLIVKYTEPSIKNKLVYHSNEESAGKIELLMREI